MIVNKEIHKFSVFLNETYNSIIKITREFEVENIILADKIETGYLQFIWEILVEMIVCKEGQVLDYYGGGADFDELSSRVIFKERISNCMICAEVNSSLDLLSKKIIKNKDLEFIKLISYCDGLMFLNPPFDFALCENDRGEQFIFDIHDLNFVLKEIR